MSIITAILEAEADGTLHLPVPEELRHGKVEIVATLRPAPEPVAPKQPFRVGCLKGFWMAPDFDAPLEEFREYM